MNGRTSRRDQIAAQIRNRARTTADVYSDSTASPIRAPAIAGWRPNVSVNRSVHALNSANAVSAWENSNIPYANSGVANSSTARTHFRADSLTPNRRPARSIIHARSTVGSVEAIQRIAVSVIREVAGSGGPTITRTAA